MSDLTFPERMTLESALGMASGYVLGFSNRTFQDFVYWSTGQNIYDKKYENGTCSKAFLLRKFWEIESNARVAKLLTDMLDTVTEPGIDTSPGSLYEKARRVVERLRSDCPVPDIEAVAADDSDAAELIAREVHSAIERDQPVAALDRLHTYLTHYVRRLCKKHGIGTEREKPLHGLFGEYVKVLEREGHIQSAMASRLLKSTISVLDAFNEVRNDKSPAHPNELLGYHEALFLVSSVATLTRFLRAFDERAGARAADASSDLPF